MNIVKLYIVVSFLLALFFFVGCDDNPMTPESGTISGVVDFSGTWPETGNISISVNTSWPEVTGAPYAFTTIYSDDLNQDNLYSYRFENVTFGTYQGIIVSWRDPYDDNSATNQHAIGGYGGTIEMEFEDAESVIISASDYEKPNLNFPVYLDLIDETIPAESGTISGIVTFSGVWPEGVNVLISLHSDWPETGEPDAYMSIYSDDLNQDNEYSYSFNNLIFRTYSAISVLRYINGNWVILGVYGSETPPEFEDAESVTITVTDFELSGLDFTATFSH